MVKDLFYDKLPKVNMFKNLKRMKMFKVNFINFQLY